MSEMPKVNTGLSTWKHEIVRRQHAPLAPHLPDTVYKSVVSQLAENKDQVANRLAELRLPHFKLVTAHPHAFLSDPDAYFSQLSSSTYYASLEAVGKNLDRVRKYGFSKEDALAYIQQQVDTLGSDYNRLILMETATLLYGGNLAISEDTSNPVYGELVQGTHSNLVGGLVPILLTVERDAVSGRLIFERPSQKSEELWPARHEEDIVRAGMYAALMCVPHRNADPDENGPGFGGRNRQFRPGYYEFALTGRPDLTHLSPVFIDQSNEPAFLTPPAPFLLAD